MKKFQTNQTLLQYNVVLFVMSYSSIFPIHTYFSNTCLFKNIKKSKQYKHNCNQKSYFKHNNKGFILQENQQQHYMLNIKLQEIYKKVKEKYYH